MILDLIMDIHHHQQLMVNHHLMDNLRLTHQDKEHMVLLQLTHQVKEHMVLLQLILQVKEDTANQECNHLNILDNSSNLNQVSSSSRWFLLIRTEMD